MASACCAAAPARGCPSPERPARCSPRSAIVSTAPLFAPVTPMRSVRPSLAWRSAWSVIGGTGAADTAGACAPGRRQRRSGRRRLGIAHRLLDRVAAAWPSRPPATSAASMPAPPGATTTRRAVGAPAGVEGDDQPQRPAAAASATCRSWRARRHAGGRGRWPMPYSTAPRIPSSSSDAWRPAAATASRPDAGQPRHTRSSARGAVARPGQPDHGRGRSWRRVGNRREPGPPPHVVERRARQPRRQRHEEVVAGVAPAPRPADNGRFKSGWEQTKRRPSAVATRRHMCDVCGGDQPRSTAAASATALATDPGSTGVSRMSGAPRWTNAARRHSSASAPVGGRVTGAWPAADGGRPGRDRQRGQRPHGGASRSQAGSCSRACSDMGWSCRPRCCSRRSVRRPARWPCAARIQIVLVFDSTAL